ncbi:hypothetical protein [Hyphomonas sp.]|uniref:hypothetical protein n=1 Tax=Hyphomonas sp. TaxID=87 RepID=UPI0025BF96FE|nr:hypothetical protein [Hyphomonas sp.]
MVFKMIMDASSEEEKPVVRGFLKHLVLGFAGGVAVGSIMLAILLLSLQGMDLDMPLLWIFAMMLQCGPVGGLIGIGVYLSRVTERDSDKDDDDESGPGGNATEPASHEQIVVRADTGLVGRLKPSKA